MGQCLFCYWLTNQHDHAFIARFRRQGTPLINITVLYSPTLTGSTLPPPTNPPPPPPELRPTPPQSMSPAEQWKSRQHSPPLPLLALHDPLNDSVFHLRFLMTLFSKKLKKPSLTLFLRAMSKSKTHRPSICTNSDQSPVQILDSLRLHIPLEEALRKFTLSSKMRLKPLRGRIPKTTTYYATSAQFKAWESTFSEHRSMWHLLYDSLSFVSSPLRLRIDRYSSFTSR